MQAGLLGYQPESRSEEWDFSSYQPTPAMGICDPLAQMMSRRERSLKVSTAGWKAILNVLR